MSVQIYHPKKIQEDGEKCKAIRSMGKPGSRVDVSVVGPWQQQTASFADHTSGFFLQRNKYISYTRMSRSLIYC
jgi:hypothetical protein